jgi:hypothetical protein
MTLNLGRAEQGTPDPALLQLCIFLLEQLGGSVALSYEDQHKIFNSDKRILSIRQREPDVLILKVDNDDDQQRNV